MGKVRVKFSKLLLVLNTLVLFIQCNVDNHDNLTVFRYNEAASVSTLDPAFVKSQSENWIVTQINAGLIQLDTLLQVQPMIADSWEISKDGREYVFHLKSNVYFHGWKNHAPRKLSAYDVQYSFKRLMDPKTASPGTWVFSDKVNLEENPFTAIDSFTFRLKLVRSFPPLLGILSMPYCYILPKEAVEHYGKDFRNNPVGCGPFVFKRWEEQVGMVLLKFDQYFEYGPQKRRLPYLDAVNIDLNPNKSSAFMDFSTGKYDFFNEIEAGVKDEILDPYGNLTPKYKGRYQLKKAPFLNTEFLMFNMQSENPLLQSVKIRKAMNLLINREAIVNNVRNGLGIASYHGFTPPSLLSSKTKGYGLNKKEAQRLILESELDISQPLTLGVTSDYMDMALFIKNDLESAGFQIKIDIHPGSYLRQLRNGQQLDFYRGSWIADYPDAENYLACFYGANHYPKGPNYSRFQDDAFDKLYNQAMLETNSKSRGLLMNAMDSILIQDPPFICLYYDKSLRITKPSVKHLFSYPNNMLQLKYVIKD